MQKSKESRNFKPSPALSELIEKINYLPADFPLPDAKRLLEEVFSQRQGMPAPPANWILQNAHYESEMPFYADLPTHTFCYDATCATLDRLRETFKDFPLFIENILENPDSDLPFPFDSFDGYASYMQLRKSFFNVVEQIEKSRSRNLKVPNTFKLLLPSIPTTFEINSDGSIKFHGNPIITALHGADLTLLRQCDVCGKFFYAARSNQIRCSRKCSNLYHQRKYQADPEKKAAYNKRRQDNYELIKKGKVKTTKRNKNDGTL